MQPIYELPKITLPSSNINFAQTMIILGTSANGPLLEPTLISSLSNMEKIFGTSGNLYKGFKQAYEVNNSIPIYIMRVTGKTAKYEFTGVVTDWIEEVQYELIGNILRIESIYAGSIYNQIRIKIEQDDDEDYYFKIYFPIELNKPNISYNLSNMTSINELVKIINVDSNINTNYIKASTPNPDFLIEDFLILNMNKDVYLSEGEDGLNPTKNNLFFALEQAYEILIGFNVNIIVPLEAFFDDYYEGISSNLNYYGSYQYIEDRDYLALTDTENGNRFVTFHGQLIRFCKEQLDVGIMSHGVLSMSLISDLTELEKPKYIYDWVNSTPIQSRYDLTYKVNNEYIDDGKFISIVIGDFTYNKDLPNEYRFAWNACYGAMISSLEYDKTTTNKSIPITGNITYDIDNDEINYFSVLGIVCPRISVRNGLVVGNGVTAAISSDSMHYIINTRQVQITLNELNRAVSIYKGESITPLINNGIIEKLIDSTLKELKNQGLLIDYRYNLEYDKNSSSGIIKVDLLTKNMIEFVSSEAQLSLT